MKNGLVVSDSGPIFSLAIVDKLDILRSLFDELYIPKAVWEELTRDQTTAHYQKIVDYWTIDHLQTVYCYEVRDDFRPIQATVPA